MNEHIQVQRMTVAGAMKKNDLIKKVPLGTQYW